MLYEVITIIDAGLVPDGRADLAQQFRVPCTGQPDILREYRRFAKPGHTMRSFCTMLIFLHTKPGNLDLVLTRITSYNVCYTKLLRS